MQHTFKEVTVSFVFIYRSNDGKNNIKRLTNFLGYYPRLGVNSNDFDLTTIPPRVKDGGGAGAGGARNPRFRPLEFVFKCCNQGGNKQES